jgi:hypothetical protein
MSYERCPYCKKEVEIMHDDGQGYEEGVLHEQECEHCEKTFGFYTSINFYYDLEKVPCLNGEPHTMEDSPSWGYPERKICSECEFENRGAYIRPDKKE